MASSISGKLIRSQMPCPLCDSSDAYAEYKENFYCFSCQRTKYKGNSVTSLLETADRARFVNDKENIFTLIDAPFPAKALAWLFERGITLELIKEYGIKYIAIGKVELSNGKIINVSDRIMIAFNPVQMFRSYDDNIDKQYKLYTFGNRESLFLGRPSRRGRLVIVEDIVSAIRVGEHSTVIALLGTKLNKKDLLHIVQTYDTIIVWLDGDRPGIEAGTKIEKSLSLYKPGKVSRITTERDPKWYSDIEIKNLLDNASL